MDAYVPGQPLFHGTRHDFPKLKRNALGILWTTPEPGIAAEYARVWYDKKPLVYAWEITLKPRAKVVELTDLSQPAIRALFDATNEVRGSYLGPWTERDWAEHSDFGTLEQFRWAARFLAERRVDAVVVQDKQGTTDVRHMSVAVLRMSAIDTLQRVVISGEEPPSGAYEAQNPVPPEKPMRLKVRDWDWGGKFSVDGFSGRTRVGYIDVFPVPSDEPGAQIAEQMGGLAAWTVNSVALRGDEWKRKGYGTQLYLAGFAEAVRRSGGPVIVGAARPMRGYVGTSAAATRVWERLLMEYPAHPTVMALRFSPEDIEPWMLPRER